LFTCPTIVNKKMKEEERRGKKRKANDSVHTWPGYKTSTC